MLQGLGTTKPVFLLIKSYWRASLNRTCLSSPVSKYFACICLVRETRGWEREIFFLYVHIYRRVQIVACKASTWSVSLSLSLGLLSYVTALKECKAWSTTKLFNKGAQIVFVIIPTFNKAFPETLQQGDHTYIFMSVSMCLYYWIRACQALEILGEGSYLLETQVSSFCLQSHPQAVRWKLRLGWEFMLKLLF